MCNNLIKRIKTYNNYLILIILYFKNNETERNERWKKNFTPFRFLLSFHIIFFLYSKAEATRANRALASLFVKLDSNSASRLNTRSNSIVSEVDEDEYSQDFEEIGLVFNSGNGSSTVSSPVAFNHSSPSVKFAGLGMHSPSPSPTTTSPATATATAGVMRSSSSLSAGKSPVSINGMSKVAGNPNLINKLHVNTNINSGNGSGGSGSGSKNNIYNNSSRQANATATTAELASAAKEAAINDNKISKTLIASQNIFRQQLKMLRARVDLIKKSSTTSSFPINITTDDNDNNNNDNDIEIPSLQSLHRSVPSLSEIKAQFATRRAQNVAINTAQVSLQHALRELDPNLTDAQAQLLARRYTSTV